MITAYNNKGEVEITFSNLNRLAQFLQCSVEQVKINFKENGMIATVNGLKIYPHNHPQEIPHQEDGETFGYPCTRAGECPREMHGEPEATVHVISNDPAGADMVRQYFEGRNVKIVEHVEGFTKPQNIKDLGQTKTLSREEVNELVCEKFGILHEDLVEMRKTPEGLVKLTKLMLNGVEGTRLEPVSEKALEWDIPEVQSKELKDTSKDGGNYSATGSSAHYRDNLVEYIDDIELQHGTLVAYLVCEAQVSKYRGRAGKKAGVTIEKDMVKAQWYEACAKYLKEKIDFELACQNHNIDFEVMEARFQSLKRQYGTCRDYVAIPAHIGRLFAGEIQYTAENARQRGLEFTSLVELYTAKPLGDIVDEKLANG